jgi:UDP-glucose 4-epimerase
VIGGAGFLGTHVTRKLAASERDVVVLGRRKEPKSKLPANVQYVAGDFGDRSVLDGLLEGVDEVLHLAYATVPQTSFEDPIFDILSNLPPTVQLFQSALTARVAKLVLVSSGGTVYGVVDRLPITEDGPTNPISPYGITKLTLEKYAKLFHTTLGLPVVIVRPGNAYGEDQPAAGPQGFVAAAVRAVRTGGEVTIYGPKGTIRDYIHVSDVASGIVAALDHGEVGYTYNIGTGVGRSNLDVVADLRPLAARVGLPIVTRTLDPRAFDVPANVLDASKLRRISGWESQIDFPVGLERVWHAATPDRHS